MLVFPRYRLIERDHDWNIVGNTITAGVTTGASIDVRSDGGGFWSASLNSIQFMSRTDTLLWRAIRQKCNGGVTSIIVPRRDLSWIPLPSGQSLDEFILHSDDSPFSDESGYTQSTINVTTAESASLRATTLLLNLVNCAGSSDAAQNIPRQAMPLPAIAVVHTPTVFVELIRS